MLRKVRSSFFMPVLIILLESTLQRNNGERYHSYSRYRYFTVTCLSFTFRLPNLSDARLTANSHFRPRTILHSSIWPIKVSLVGIQQEMPSPSGSFSRMVIILEFLSLMRKTWDSTARGLDVSGIHFSQGFL